MQSTEFLNNLCILKLSSVLYCPTEKAYYPMQNSGRIAHGFIYTLSGTETYHFKDKTLRVEPGTVLYLPKDAQYTITFEGEKSECYVMNFEINTAFPCPFLTKFEQNSRTKELFTEAERKWKHKKTGYYPECLSLFYELVATLLKKETQYVNSDNFRKIAKATEYLKTHFTESELRIEQLAKMSEMSVKHFETLFYKKFSVTPKEYILLLKMERAKELLQASHMSVADIAFALGYNDIYHFSKIFKAKTGCSPQKYKKTFK